MKIKNPGKSSILLGLSLMLLPAVLLVGCIPNDIQTISLQMPDISGLEDGAYSGVCETSLVSAEVEVTLEESGIAGIVITRHDTGRGEKAEVIADRVVEAQTIDVDTVSGATASSIVILKAIEDALTP